MLAFVDVLRGDGRQYRVTSLTQAMGVQIHVTISVGEAINTPCFVGIQPNPTLERRFPVNGVIYTADIDQYGDHSSTSMLSRHAK